MPREQRADRDIERRGARHLLPMRIAEFSPRDGPANPVFARAVIPVAVVCLIYVSGIPSESRFFSY